MYSCSLQTPSFPTSFSQAASFPTLTSNPFATSTSSAFSSSTTGSSFSGFTGFNFPAVNFSAGGSSVFNAGAKKEVLVIFIYSFYFTFCILFI